jgi:multidrug efflux pump subunit AcrA (membrane-fusion protein)
MVLARGLLIPLALFTAACQQVPEPAAAPAEPAPASPRPTTKGSEREVRATGRTRAVKEFIVLVPQITGQSGRLTLTRLVPTGAKVDKDDVLAEFDRIQQIDNARDARARFDDFGHQVNQKKAENRSNSEKRAEEMQQARAALAKADVGLRKAEVLPEIERQKNIVLMADAKARIASLEKSHRFREEAEAAALRILELKQDRQKVALDRSQRNLERLIVRAPLAGMVAIENTWRNNSMGPPQDGDPMYPGQPLLRIFDPSQMDVIVLMDEPDGAALAPGVLATVKLDAYPELSFGARLESASQVASAAVNSPIKRFNARFRVLSRDPRLLPDMAAAVIIEQGAPVAAPERAGARP